jgi:tRNA (guanine6-N2)-methyltransferase
MAQSTTSSSFFEASVPEGLEAIVQNELHMRLGGQERILVLAKPRPGVIQFTYSGKPAQLLQLKTVFSLFAGTCFNVPRPLALLGDQSFRLMMQRVKEIVELSPKDSYHSLYLAAAGSDSKVMLRLAEEIAKQTGLMVVKDEGDLLVRMRRPLNGGEGWDVLVRMTPRPLSARKWRECDHIGSLNAAVAAALVSLSRPRADDVFLDLTCGSGTILVERAANGPAQQVIGCDNNGDALACAKRNIHASGYESRIQAFPWDARKLLLDDASVDVICADLPFGADERLHDENLILYPKILKEAARVARPKARAVFLTHELRLMDTLLNVSRDWSVEAILPITINGMYPRIYALKRG